MNWKHIEAIILGESRIYRGECDGTVLVSNGHIAVAVKDEFAIPTGAKEEDIAKPWRKALPLQPSPQPIGDVASYGEEQWARHIGGRYVNERFYRAFADCSWTLPADTKDPFTVHQDGVLVALVMPLRVDNPSACESPSDKELFAPIASETNDWYLVSQKELQKRIDRLESDLDEKEERLNELEGEIEEIRKALDSLRSRKRGVAA